MKVVSRKRFTIRTCTRSLCPARYANDEDTLYSTLLLLQPLCLPNNSFIRTLIQCSLNITVCVCVQELVVIE